MTQPQILVTGASGTVGSALLAQLAQLGIPARAGVRTLPAVPTSDLITYVHFDFGDPVLMDAAMQGIRTLFLLTPNAADAVAYAQAAVQAARQAGIAHIVRLSAYSTPDEMHNPHRIIDALLAESGIPFTVLQPGPFMQNFVFAFGPTIRAQSALYEPLMDARVSYIDARDIARTAAVILSDPSAHAGATYVLTGPEALSDYDIASILTDVTGRPIQYVPISDDAARASLTGIGLPEPVVESVIGLYGLMRAGKRSHVTTHIEHITGQPATSFAVFARDYASAFTS
ncbi:MAG: NmrA family NAD(P)-binding protein [Pleurocapsa minor GSE-CHR-MK-17-07R]|jgi:uncharacterized protein YbjT (DUF2867 family)|nr:NmrA family NAD(P)-binding protein [Pleurocapsa minor GSE-CHR-MK 17-07R]